ncbi:MAG: polyphenol oxidase family protein [Parachlamydiaceae bacterium]
MIHKQNHGVQWLEFELLADCPLIHGCLMRHGGYSTGDLDSLNLGRHVGDTQKNVESNFKKVVNALSLSQLATSRICHGADVTEISSTNTPISDGLMTRVENLAISMSQADCQAAIFYDPINHALANIHCGRRSNVLNIYENSVNAMKVGYGSNPKDLLVCISPSLGPEHSEFINYRNELPEPFWDFQVKPLYFDLWAISEWQLRGSGVLPHHIQIARIDTYGSKDFFSVRSLRTCGRQATICALKSNSLTV